MSLEGHSGHSRYPGVSAPLPKATEVLRCHEAPLCADIVAKVFFALLIKIFRAVDATFV